MTKSVDPGGRIFPKSTPKHSALGDDSMIKYNVISNGGNDDNDQEGGLNKCPTTPSVGHDCSTLDGRKLQDWDEVANLPLQSDTDLSTNKTHCQNPNSTTTQLNIT